MKKIFALILIVLYASASSGTIINLHYCMGHLASVKVDSISLKSCMCGPEQPSGDCCKDELTVIKVNDAYKQSTSDVTFNTGQKLLPQAISLMDVSKITTQKVYIAANQRPPDIGQPSPLVLHCVFRI